MKEHYCLARINRVLEVFQLPFDTPSILAPGLEVLWCKEQDQVIFQGHYYQIKAQDRTAFTVLDWVGGENLPPPSHLVPPSAPLPPLALKSPQHFQTPAIKVSHDHAAKVSYDNATKVSYDEKKTVEIALQTAPASSSFYSLANTAPAGSLEERMWIQLRTCYDPEIPVNIVDLGLIYQLTLEPRDQDERAGDKAGEARSDSNADGAENKSGQDNHQPTGKYLATVRMTLTNPACSMGDQIIEEIKHRLSVLPEIEQVKIELVFDPPWSYDRLSEQAKLKLGLL